MQDLTLELECFHLRRGRCESVALVANNLHDRLIPFWFYAKHFGHVPKQSRRLRVWHPNCVVKHPREIDVLVTLRSPPARLHCAYLFELFVELKVCIAVSAYMTISLILLHD
jgi:hypothetical protein